MSGFQVVGLFLASIFFTTVIYTLWLRIALRFFHVSSLNPISQIIYNASNTVISPLNKLFKISDKPITHYDWTAFAVLVLVEIIKLLVLCLIFSASMPISIFCLYILGDLIVQPCDALFYLLLIQVLVSWINPGLQHPILTIVRTINAPLLRFARSLLPNMSGFDFSPVIIIIALKIITLFIRHSLPWPII